MSIPLTEMHLLFRSVTTLPQREQAQRAEQLLAQPGHLRACFERSVEQFEPYSNIDQPFHPGTKKPADLGPIGARFGLALAAGYCFDTHPALDFAYVDREVVPSRTTPQTTFEDGSQARTQPRVDALLVNRRDRLPIVAEVKVCRDKTPFVALIQALAGAGQLVSAAQRARLQEHYAGARFEFRVPAGLIDVYLIFVNPPGKARYWHELRVSAGHLAQEVAGAAALRRIAFIDAEYAPPNPPTLIPIAVKDAASEELT